MGVVCFRAILQGAELETAAIDLNQLNEAIVAAVQATGRAYLTHTTLNGKTAMRIGIGNVLTTSEHLVSVFGLIRQHTHELKRSLARARKS